MFLDYDNDGWSDILLCNGHVYPEVAETAVEYGYRQRKVLYRNLRNGRFSDVSAEAGPGILEIVPGRGCAVGDYDNDGDLDVVVNCVNDVPQLLRCDSELKNSWIKLKLVGTRSNRSAIGARVICEAEGRRQMDEVRSGGSYISQNDLRIHFGLGAAHEAVIEVRWPSGSVEKLSALAANKVYVVTEGSGVA
jgi:enediyne biosynthesis protein E4